MGTCGRGQPRVPPVKGPRQPPPRQKSLTDRPEKQGCSRPEPGATGHEDGRPVTGRLPRLKLGDRPQVLPYIGASAAPGRHLRQDLRSGQGADEQYSHKVRAVRRQGPGKWLATKRPLVSGVSRALKRAAWYPYYLYPPLGAGTGLAPASPDGSPLPAGPRSLTGRLRAVAQRARSAERAPFFRLALVHGLSSAGDAIVAIALAGSIFFNVSVTAAQSKVALSLALTVAPFAIVGPLLGPLVERARGGRRAMAIFSAGGRATCCFLMAFWATPWPCSRWRFSHSFFRSSTW